MINKAKLFLERRLCGRRHPQSKERVMLSALEYNALYDMANHAIELKKSLQLFIPQWAKDVPEGLSPMDCGTSSYEGDLNIKNKLDKLFAEYKSTIDSLPEAV